MRSSSWARRWRGMQITFEIPGGAISKEVKEELR
jgi:hypothetical protein